MRRIVNAVLALTLAFACLAMAPASAQTTAKPASPASAAPQPAPIDRNGVLILIRSTLLALHQANETGNYTVLRDLAAPGFQEVNNAARLGEIFANLRAQKLDLSGAVILEPQLTVLPQIEANGFMRLAGYFPSIPNQINFELLYAPVEGRWRTFGVSVGVSSSTPAAPPAPEPKPNEAAKPSPRPAVPRTQP